MDLVTGLICIVCVVASSVIIYLILSISSVKENSFDEIKANRRKLLQQYKDETRLNSEKAKEKKSKKAKKAKEKQGETEKLTNAASNRELESQTDDEKENMLDHQNIESLPVDDQIIQDMKPNKREILPKQENALKDVKVVEEFENENSSSDSVGGKTERKENKKSKSGGSNKAEGNKKPVKGDKELVLKQVVQPSGDGSGDAPLIKDGAQLLTKSTSVQVLKPPVQNSNKPKAASVVEDYMKKITADYSKEIIVKETNQQNMKDVQAKPILQCSSKSGKKKKSDVASLQQLSSEKDAVNINLLMPLLQKAELSRSEIQLLIDALLNKQQQESSEWLKGRQDPLVKLKKQLAEKEKALIDEQEASNGLQAKLKELRTELNAEKSNARHLEENMSAKENEFKALSKKNQQMIDENQSLLLKNQQLQKQLSDELVLVSKLKEEQVLKQNMYITHEQHHEVMLSLQSSISTLGEENTVLQERLRIQEEYSTDLNRHLSNSQFETKQLQGQLAESRAEVEKLSHIIQALQSKNDSLLEDNEQLSGQVSSNACQENSHLENSKDSRENGDVYSSSQDHNLTNLHSLLEEKETLLNQLNIELDNKENHIEKLKNEIIVCKNDANKKQTLLENANMDLSKIKSQNLLLSSELKETGAVVNDLRNELVKKKEEVTLLRKDIEMHKQRNNELRNKNWKVAEALATAEQALQKCTPMQNTSNDEDKKDSVSHLKLQITQLFHRIFPDMLLEDYKDTEVWLSKVEKAAMAAIESQPSSLNLSDLEAQNRQLQTMVSHYKAIINYTEGMLNSLQTHIEVEETRWGEKIEALQAELDLIKGNHPKKD